MLLSTDIGGLIGSDNSGAYTACFWDADLNPDVNGIGDITEPNVIAKSTTEMHTESTYTDEGWDFIDIWTICGYPRLFYQQLTPPDYLCLEGIDFVDYSFFADHYGLTDCFLTNDCNSTDLDFSGAVDIKDVNIFTNYWMFGK
jgi:hypothetical protein